MEVVLQALHVDILQDVAEHGADSCKDGTVAGYDLALNIDESVTVSLVRVGMVQDMLENIPALQSHMNACHLDHNVV